MKKFSRRVLRRLKHLALLLLLSLTGYLVLGRLLVPMLPTQTEAVEARLSTLLNAEVSIGDMRAEWFRFAPILTLRDLQVRTSTDSAVHSIESAELSLDTSASLMKRRLVIDSLGVSGLSLTLQQQPDGRWGLAGLSGDGPSNTDLMLDFLLQANRISLNEADLLLQDNNGQQISLGSIYFNIRNSGSSHEAQVQLRVNGQQSPARAVVQMEGDPRSEFTATAWLDSERLDWLPLAERWLPSAWQWQQLQGQTRLWVTLDSAGLQRVSGTLDEVEVQARHSNGRQLLALQSGALAFRAVPHADGPASGWGLQLEGLHFDWQNVPRETGPIQIDAAASNLQIRAASLDLEMLTQVLTSAIPMPERGRDALETVSPKGLMRNVHVETALDGSYPQGFFLRGNLENASVEAWQQAPAATGINAYVEASVAGGMAELDSSTFSIHLPQLFVSGWQYDRINARIKWQADRDEVRVQSSIIDVANAALEGRVRFNLHNTRDGDGHWTNEFELQVGMQRMQVEAGKVYLPMLERLQQTMDWLDDALLGGELGQSGFVLHSLSGAGVASPSAQGASWYRVTGGRLQFLPDWPVLENIEAGVVVRDEEVDVVARSGSLAGIALDGAQARVRAGAGESRHLSLATHAGTDTTTGLAFLKNTPVHAKLGGFLDNWEASGALDIKVALGVDLRDHTLPPTLKVEVATQDSVLNMTDYALELENINGVVNYSSRNGLGAEGLTARLFDFPVEAAITTAAASSPQETISIRGNGRASASALQQWSGQPGFVRQLFGYMKGETEYQMALLIEPQPGAAQKQTRLVIESNLAGIESSLPQPLAKTATQRRPLTVELGFSGNTRTLNLQYQDWLSGALVLDEAGIERGQISLGARNRNFNVRQSDRNATGVLVSGDLDSFDVPAWQRFVNELDKSDGSGRSVSDYLRLVDVNVGELMLPGRSLEKVNVVVEHPEDAWRIRARNDFLAGELLLPDDETRPWDVTLEYLRFPPRPVPEEGVADDEAEEVDPLQDVNPTTLPPFSFSVAELSVGEQNLGAFSFQFMPHRFGANITNLRMRSPDSSIMDASGTIGANMEWSYRQGRHGTTFAGVFAAGDLSRVLPAWGHSAHVTSEAARFDSAVQWPGSPLHFSLKRISGTVDLAIEDGRFVEINSRSTRLLGALNFDALVRRLQLDFSDIFGTGYSFDTINGFLTFSSGVVRTTDSPLRINGPSSDISINGEINLERETIAADMQVKIPLGQNVSMVAGLLGAWPIALSTYIASKILQESVEDFATVVYRLEGPWSNPTAGFEAPAAR